MLALICLGSTHVGSDFFRVHLYMLALVSVRGARVDSDLFGGAPASCSLVVAVTDLFDVSKGCPCLL